MDLAHWSWPQFWDLFLRVGLAFVLSLPVGVPRERSEHAIGLRTFPLVAVASCGFVLAIQGTVFDLAAASRVLQGLITGIGFIGGGAILRQGRSVHGTAVAASIWATAAVGAAVGLRHDGIAIVLTFFNVVAMFVLLPLKRFLDRSTVKRAPQ